jgi:hypothetical protein
MFFFGKQLVAKALTNSLNTEKEFSNVTTPTTPLKHGNVVEATESIMMMSVKANSEAKNQVRSFVISQTS